MLWHGDVADDTKTDIQTQTIRTLNQSIQSDERVDFSLLPLSDGLSFIRKKNNLPPFQRFISLILSSNDERKLQKQSFEFKNYINTLYNIKILLTIFYF
mgnify:CR=1 FL=1